MGISECGPKVFAHVRTEVQLGDFKGKRLAVDIASFKQKAWYQDVCSYYRANEPATHGYRASLACRRERRFLALGAEPRHVPCAPPAPGKLSWRPFCPGSRPLRKRPGWKSSSWP